MLSTENPPSDPPCTQLIINSHSSSYERASHKQLALPEVAPDLSKDHTPPPNFSIRDYVFTTRSKDIKKNWPFSLKNLQLCLKHGVKDLLPPFDSTNTSRSQHFETDSAKDNCLSKIDVGLNRKLQVHTCTYGSSSRSGGEKDFPSTTTSISLSEIESVAANKLSSPHSEVDTSLEPLVEVAAEGPPKNQKYTTARLPTKKCRLIVKFGGNSDRSSTEDIVSNTTTISEPMASKVCPVCKTFSSSSNTTLNAHIDQCLSGEPTRKWPTSDCKLSTHRIKPAKTRSMADVYSTAQRCTLEELDRRNGTNWAASTSLPSQDAETIAAEGRKERVSQVHHPKEAGDVGAVYIDSSGTKVRILSKLSDAPVVSKGVDVEPRKHFKGGKVNKLFLTKKKMKHALKHQKFPRLTPQSKKLRSYNDKAHKSKIYGGKVMFNATKVGDERGSKVQNFKSFEHAKPSDRGTLGTGLARKVNNRDGHQPLRCESHRYDKHDSSDSLVDRSHVQRLANCSENIGCFAGVSDRMESSSHEASDSERQWSPRRKRMRSSLVAPRNNRDAERGFLSLKQKTDNDDLRKCAMPMREVLKWKAPSCIVNHASGLVSNEEVKKRAGSPNDDSDTSPCESTKPSRSCHGFPTKSMRLLPLRKKVPSSSQARETESEAHAMAEVNKEVVAWHTKSNQQQEMMQICTVNRSGREYISDDEDDSLDRSISTSQREEVTVDADEGKDIDFSYRDNDDDEGKSIDFSYRDSDDDFSDEYDSIKDQDTAADDDDDSSPKLAVEDSLARLSKSLDPEFHKAGNCMDTQPDSLQPMEDYNKTLCGQETRTCTTNEPNFEDQPVMFSTDVGGNEINVQSSRVGTESNCEMEQGNSFLEVEPIPIPGPPGSFLPSPGGDDSSEEDFQGNSSLTTSRFLSSHDQHELVINRCSSESPVSATSSISNSAAARFDEPLPAVKDKIGSGFFGVDIEPSVENACTEAERYTTDGERLKVSKTLIEKGHRDFRNDDQLCCCSRKEKVTQDASLYYEEPQLLRQRAPAAGKQMNEKPNSRPDHIDTARPEMFPLSSCGSLGSEKVFSPVGVKFSGRCDSDMASPSGSNPVLRLMGKNLMVVNKDEDAYPAQSVPSPLSSTQYGHQLFPGIYPGNTRSQDYNSFHPFINQGVVSFSRDPHNSVGQPISYSFRSQQPSFQPTLRAPVAVGHIGGSYAVYAEPREYRGESLLPTRHDRHRNRPNGASMSMSNHRHKNSAAGTANGVREVIIIDDGAESEGCKQVEVQSHGLTYGNVFSPYHQPRDGSMAMQGVHFQVSPSGRWNCTSEGPPQQRTLYNGAVPPPTSHIRSAHYYSPSMSYL